MASFPGHNGKPAAEKKTIQSFNEIRDDGVAIK